MKTPAQPPKALNLDGYKIRKRPNWNLEGPSPTSTKRFNKGQVNSAVNGQPLDPREAATPLFQSVGQAKKDALLHNLNPATMNKRKGLQVTPVGEVPPPTSSVRPLTRAEVKKTTAIDMNSMAELFLHKDGLMERIFAYKLMHGRVDSCTKVKEAIRLDDCVNTSNKKNVEQLKDPIRLEDYNCPPAPGSTFPVASCMTIPETSVPPPPMIIQQARLNLPHSSAVPPPIQLDHHPTAILKAPLRRGPCTPVGSPGPTILSTARQSTPRQGVHQPEVIRHIPEVLSQSIEQQDEQQEVSQIAEALSHSTQVEILELEEQEDDREFCEAIEPDPTPPIFSAPVSQNTEIQSVQLVNQAKSDVQPLSSPVLRSSQQLASTPQFDSQPVVKTSQAADTTNVVAQSIASPPKIIETSQPSRSQKTTNGRQEIQEENALLTQLKILMGEEMHGVLRNLDPSLLMATLKNALLGIVAPVEAQKEGTKVAEEVQQERNVPEKVIEVSEDTVTGVVVQEEEDKQAEDTDWEIICEEGEIVSDGGLEEVSAVETLVKSTREQEDNLAASAVQPVILQTSNLCSAEDLAERNSVGSNPLPTASSLSQSLHSLLQTSISGTQTALEMPSNHESPEKPRASSPSVANTAIPLSPGLEIQTNRQVCASSSCQTASTAVAQPPSGDYSFPPPPFPGYNPYCVPIPMFLPHPPFSIQPPFSMPPPPTNTGFFFPPNPPPLLHRTPNDHTLAASQSRPNPAIEKVLASFSSIQHQPVLFMDNEVQKGAVENNGQEVNISDTPQQSQEKSLSVDVRAERREQQQMKTGVDTGGAPPSPNFVASSTNSSNAAVALEITSPTTVHSKKVDMLPTSFQRCILSSFFSPPKQMSVLPVKSSGAAKKRLNLQNHQAEKQGANFCIWDMIEM